MVGNWWGCLMLAGSVAVLACDDGGDTSTSSTGGASSTSSSSVGGGAGGMAPCTRWQESLQSELDALCTAEGTQTLGAVLAVQVEPDTRFVAACGHSDLAQTIPMTTGDRFRVGSVTKTFTSVLVLRLM